MFQACRSQSRGPQTLAASPRLAHPGPDCLTASPTQARSQAPDPCTSPAQSSWLFFSSAYLYRPPNSHPAHLNSTYKHRTSLFPYTLPFFFQPGRFISRFLSRTLHFITLPVSHFTRRIKAQNNSTGLGVAHSPKTARVLSLLCLPSSGLASPHCSTLASHQS